jgi:hypothetical protein
MFCVSCCDVRYDCRINTMFGWSLQPVVCRLAHVLFVFVYIDQVGNWQPVDSRCYYRHCYEREDIKLSAHDAFLDYPSSGTLKIEDWKAK